MEQDNLRRMDDLIDDVVREIKNRIYHNEGDSCEYRTNKMRTLVLGELTQTELRALRSFSEVLHSQKDGEWDVVLAAQIPVGTMAYSALLLPGDDTSTYLIEGLQKGKKVYLLESGLEYRNYRKTASKTLYQKYQEFEDILRRYGCEVISDVLHLTVSEGNPLKITVKAQEEPGAVCHLEEKRLLKESDLSRVRKEGCTGLLIGKQTIITPLAQDYITNHNLVVRRK